MRRSPRLSPEALEPLVERIRAGDDLARDELAVASLRFAWHVARRIERKRRLYEAEVEDVFQDAAIGLLRAARLYQPGLGPWPPYAFEAARRSAWNGVDARRTGRPTHAEVVSLEAAEAALWRRLGREPTVAELARETEISAWRVLAMRGRRISLAALELPDQAPGPEISAATEATRAAVRRAAEQLPPRQRRVVLLRLSVDEPTLEDVGRANGTGPQAAQQLEARALAALAQSKPLRRLWNEARL